MDNLFEIASKVSTPLGIGGIAVVALFLLYRQFLKLPVFAQLTKMQTYDTLNKLMKYVLYVALLAIVLAVIAYIVPYVIPKKETPLEGMLTPDGKRTPSAFLTACDALQDWGLSEDLDLEHVPKLLFGGSVAAITEFGEMVIATIEDEPVLWLDWKPEGVLVSANVFSRNDRVVAQIVDNQFHINPNNYFRIDRPSRSELIVYDQYLEEVLDVHLHNETSIEITGRFQASPGTPSMIVTDEAMSYVGGTAVVWSKGCFVSDRSGTVFSF